MALEYIIIIIPTLVIQLYWSLVKRFFFFFWTIYEEYRLVSGYAKFASKYAQLTVVLVAWCRVIMSRVACQLVSGNVAHNYKALGFNSLITYLYRFVSYLIACFICTFIRHPGCCYKHGRFTLCHIHSVISGSTWQTWSLSSSTPGSRLRTRLVTSFR